ncbi:MAG: hypothetical protein FWD89_03610 [Firmicutes bacterium]|nr:hypothetical protein [Bacillota bacterium]
MEERVKLEDMTSREIEQQRYRNEREERSLANDISNLKERIKRPRFRPMFTRIELEDSDCTFWADNVLPVVGFEDGSMSMVDKDERNDTPYFPGRFAINGVKNSYALLAEKTEDMSLISRVPIVGLGGTALAVWSGTWNLIGDVLTTGVVGAMELYNIATGPFQWLNNNKKRKAWKKELKRKEKEHACASAEREAFELESEPALIEARAREARQERIDIAKQLGLPESAVDHPRFDEYVEEAEKAESARVAAETKQETVEDAMKGLKLASSAIIQQAKDAEAMIAKSRNQLIGTEKLKKEIINALAAPETP